MPFADRDGTAEPVRETQTEALPLGVPLERALPLLAREAEGPAEGVFVAASEADAFAERDLAAEEVGAEREALTDAVPHGVALPHAVADARPVVVFEARGEPVGEAEGLTVLEELATLRVWEGVAQPETEKDGDTDAEVVRTRDADDLTEEEGVIVPRDALAFAEAEPVVHDEGEALNDGCAEADKASEVVRVNVAPTEAEPLTDTVEEGVGADDAVMEVVPSQFAAVRAICPQKAAPLEDMQRGAVPAGHVGPGVWHQ